MRSFFTFGEPFPFADIWDSWQKPDGEKIETCTILKTQANELMADFHHRMPVILPKDEAAAWLDKYLRDPQKAKQYLGQYPAEQMEMYEISKLVNSPKNDGPNCRALSPKMMRNKSANALQSHRYLQRPSQNQLQ